MLTENQCELTVRVMSQEVTSLSKSQPPKVTRARFIHLLTVTKKLDTHLSVDKKSERPCRPWTRCQRLVECTTLIRQAFC